MKKLEHILPILAIASTLIVIVLLGTRKMDSFDLGYHLAFGETFFKTGTIVDHTPFIYTLPPSDIPASDRPEPGPGNWYDNEGRYHFPNSNWLSQLFIFGFWSLSDIIGLNILQIILLVGMLACLAAAMRKSQVPYPLISLTLMLLVLIVNLRPAMRPELFGFLFLSIQYMMLIKLTIHTDEPKPPSWTWVGAMIFVQLLYVNFHSYFILGLTITGAILTEYLLHALMVRFVARNIPRFKAYKKVISRLCITLIGMVLACFINPWGWRLALLPFHTLLYLKRNNIGSTVPTPQSHPWAYIAELQKSIGENWPTSITDYILLLILIFATTVIITQLFLLFFNLYQYIKRHKRYFIYQSTSPLKMRWSHLFMIIGLMLVALKMQRNISIASIIIIPSTLICVTEYTQSFLARKSERIHLSLLTFVTFAVVILCVHISHNIIIEKSYYGITKFGFGIDSEKLPTGPAAWLSKNALNARVWCDFDSSSTINFFTRPHKEVPILTNGWAYPSSVMSENEHFNMRHGGFNYIAEKYNIDAVVLHSGNSRPLIHQLTNSHDWNLEYIEGASHLFMRQR